MKSPSENINPPARLYAERDIEDQGEHYVRHVNAMTAEGLHSKSDIAAELAHRDIEIERLRSLIERAHTIISIREVSFRTHKGAAWLQQPSRELKDRTSAPESSAFGDMPPRPSRPTKMLDIQTATTQQALEHYMLVVDYWIAEAQWQEKRGDQLNQELTAFLRTANRRAAREPANADGLIAALHLLKGHAQSPIHCETADRAIREIEGLTREIAHRDELERFAAPLSCATHGLVPNLALFENKCPACERDLLRTALTDWLRTFGSTDTLSIRTRALINVQPADASASERCHFRAFGSLPCEKPKGHDGDHVCKWPETAPSVDAEDAAKWRALRNCARITAMGSAGLGDDKAAEDYGHVTLNFWTGVDDVDRGPGYARDWLDKFVEKARRSKVSRPAAAGLATGSTDQPAPETIVSPTLAKRIREHFQRPGCAGIFPLGQEILAALTHLDLEGARCRLSLNLVDHERRAPYWTRSMSTKHPTRQHARHQIYMDATWLSDNAIGTCGPIEDEHELAHRARSLLDAVTAYLADGGRRS